MPIKKTGLMPYTTENTTRKQSIMAAASAYNYSAYQTLLGDGESNVIAKSPNPGWHMKKKKYKKYKK